LPDDEDHRDDQDKGEFAAEGEFIRRIAPKKHITRKLFCDGEAKRNDKATREARADLRHAERLLEKRQTDHQPDHAAKTDAVRKGGDGLGVFGFVGGPLGFGRRGREKDCKPTSPDKLAHDNRCKNSEPVQSGAGQPRRIKYLVF
jgi:hypothetical protein